MKRGNDKPDKLNDLASGILDLEEKAVQTLEVKDDQMRDICLERLRDMVKLSRIKFCEKYEIKERTYYTWKRNFIIYYGIEPRVLFNVNILKNIKEYSPYINDEKYKLPLEEQLEMPTSVVKDKFYFTRRKTVEIDGQGTIRRVWLKQEADKLDVIESIHNAIKSLFIDNIKSLPIIKPPTMINQDLLTFYPLSDLHLGVLVDGDSSNHDIDFNLEKNKKLLSMSIDYLIDHSPNSETCVIADLGDFLHSSSDLNRTKSGHALDVDQKHSKIVRVAFESMRLLIEKALKKHKIVYFYSVPGNHSEYISIYLKEFLAAWFKDNERFIVDVRNKSQQYHRFGSNILGFSHGHELKPEKSAEVLLYDNQEFLSESKYRYFHFGHFHTGKVFSTPMVKIEVHSSPVVRDFYSENMGFRGDMGTSKAIVYHKQYGEISRINFVMDIKKL